MDLAAYLCIALLFVVLVTREVIAPASLNQYDRRWPRRAPALTAPAASTRLSGLRGQQGLK